MSSHIQKSCVGLEATLSDSKKKYGDKVNALLSAWEHVTNFVPAATPETTQSLIEWVHKHTLKLVLRGEWPKLSPATKTHLSVTLQRCATHLAHHPVASKCTALISLVHNPWVHPALDSILNGKPDSEHEEEFCCSEKGELLTMRLKILCEDRCEDIAVNLAGACVRSLRRSEGLRSVSESHHVHYMIDVYIVLLYKLKRTQDIFAQLKLMDLNDGLELVQRLSCEKLTKYRTARVWRNSLKAAELVAQYLVTAGMVRPVSETGANVLEQILNSWAILHTKLKDTTPTLPGMIRKLIEPAESAQHIYIFCAVLTKHFGESIKSLMIELYIRALTTDMNELETQKAKSDKDKVRETAKRLSAQFLKLSEVVVDSIGIARECVLTAFSLNPTRACYDRIKEVAIACGKAKHNDEPSVSSAVKIEEPPTGNTAVKDGPKCFDLKTLLVSPRKNESNEECRLHPKRSASSEGPLGELCFNCGEFTGNIKTPEASVGMERTLDALILIKGDAVTGSANYDEKSVPNQVLDAEKLGLSPQLCDDLAVVLSSPRYHMLSWVLDWKELNGLCERYLENAEGMRNTNKELKYLNIDYSQFKDWPSEEDTKDVFFGIEKGYEQWADLPSDNSEEFGSFQPAGPYKRSLTRRSLDDTTDSESGGNLQARRVGRPRKIHRLESSDSDYDDSEEKSKVFRNRTSSVSDSDTNTQDSQTDSLGSDGCRQEKKPNKTAGKDISKNRGKSKLTVESVSHFHMLMNENIRHPGEDVSGSDMSSNDIITLFSADMDENKRETIKGSVYTAASPLIITEKRSDPAVLKSLRMFRPSNTKKPTRIAQILQKNLLNKSKDNNNVGANAKFPTINLNPKIVLTRTDEASIKLPQSKKQLSAGDITNELINIQKSMPFSPNKNAIGTYQKRKGMAPVKGVKSNLGKTKYDILAKAVRDSDILAKNVPGLNSLDMMVPPRVQSTVNVVQLSRNIPQSPNTGSVNSGNTPPRNRNSTIAGNIQLPGTPSSGGHDSGVGMSPAGQTPPPRSNLHDLGEDANQPPDSSPVGLLSTSNIDPDIPRGMLNERTSQNPSPKKTPPPSSTVPLSSDQLQILCKPDGTYQLASITPNASGQRNILTLQNLEESNVSFPRQQVQQATSTSSRTTYDRPSAKPSTQSGLPKFQQAFGKTIYTLSTDTTTVAASATTETISQPTTVQKAANLSKAVQTSVQNTGISVQSVIPNFQLSTGRQILNIVQSSGNTTNVTTSTANQTLTQLVQNASSGVIYTQKIPVTLSTASLIPTISHANSIPVNRTPGVVKLNIIRAPIRQQNLSGAIQVLAAPRIQQTVRNESLISSPIEVPNQVSSTTLEQLREFESVLEQVKERSTVQPQHQTSTAATTTVQTQTSGLKHSVSALAQQLLMPSQTSANSEFSSNGNNTVTFQQEFSPQKVSLAYTTSKVPSSTPVVVVTSYCQPAASPALSVTSQSSSSPCATPAPAPVPSAGKTPPSSSSSSKSAKKAAPKTVKTSATNTSKASPIPKPQQKPQEDEQTAQRIYAILDEYAEQLRNSPDLNNKPAPRRRSNPPTNPSQSSKRKKSTSSKSKPVGVLSAELSPSTDDLGRTMGSEDSSSGIVHVQDSPAGFSGQEEPSTTPSMDTSNLTNDSNDGVELNMKRRNLIFTEPSRTVIVQEAVQTAAVSVSEALASVTGKMGNTAVLVPGNYILPMNLMKGGQQFTIVSGGSKLLATVPATVRTTGGTTGVSNALVLQSFLNQAGKLISQPKQVKIPTLQNLTSNQTLTSQSVPVIVPQTSTSVENSDKNHCDGFAKNDPCTRISTDIARGNKPPGINLIQRNVNDLAESQQICGVITSSPSLTLQGTRLFNSSIAKLSSPAKTESVVCLEKKEGGVQEKPLAIQTATIALAFAPQSEVSVISNNMQKDVKESTGMELTTVEKMISPKSVKRKMEDVAVGLMESLPRTLISTNSIVTSTVATALQSSAKIESTAALTAATKQPTVTDTTAQYLIPAGASSLNSSHQQSPPRQSHESIEAASKVGNGILCGNARLQEAWEPERKSSPDTPWRYVPTSTNQMAIEPLKVYSREQEHPDNVHSILQIINKGQGIEMASGQVYQTTTKKYFMNHTLEPFQQYANKSMVKAQPTARLDRELLQQRMERKAAAIERELRLQKSLSEECEDLGVDEPSTSDLFPEADLLFDTNHSPSFDHSSQDASCSQPLGLKSYNASYFRPLDSSSSSRDASPVADFKMTERRKNMAQRTRTIKDTVKRAKRDKLEDLQIENPAKHIRLSLENLSQDDSTSDVSRLSPMPLLENDSSKDTSQPITRVRSRNGSKEASPSSISSIPSNMKLDIDLDCESLPPGAPVNNPPSSGDESLTLLGGSTADVTIPSPLSPIVGPLPSTHKYTYSNKKRTTSKLTRTEYLSWESPISEERTRSSSEDEDSSVSESMSSQPENGIDDNVIVKTTPIDHCTYLKKKGEKLHISARVVLNRTEPRNVLVKRRHVNESFSESGALSSDKTSEPSDDETSNAGLTGPDCRARRSSLRGNMKKGCTCCNGSPERPKKKSVKLDHKLKKRLASKQLGKKR